MRLTSVTERKNGNSLPAVTSAPALPPHKAGDIDARLEETAASYEANASLLRSLKSKLELPPYEAWEEAEHNYDIEYLMERASMTREEAEAYASQNEFPDQTTEFENLPF